MKVINILKAISLGLAIGGVNLLIIRIIMEVAK